MTSADQALIAASLLPTRQHFGLLVTPATTLPRTLDSSPAVGPPSPRSRVGRPAMPTRVRGPTGTRSLRDSPAASAANYSTGSSSSTNAMPPRWSPRTRTPTTATPFRARTGLEPRKALGQQSLNPIRLDHGRDRQHLDSVLPVNQPKIRRGTMHPTTQFGLSTIS